VVIKDPVPVRRLTAGMLDCHARPVSSLAAAPSDPSSDKTRMQIVKREISSVDNNRQIELTAVTTAVPRSALRLAVKHVHCDRLL